MKTKSALDDRGWHLDWATRKVLSAIAARDWDDVGAQKAVNLLYDFYHDGDNLAGIIIGYLWNMTEKLRA